MKNKSFISTLLMAFLCHFVFAQSGLPSKSGVIMPRLLGDMTTDIGIGSGKYRAIKYDDVDTFHPDLVGSNFLFDSWAKGKLYLTMNRLLETDHVKYDIENNYFLINSHGVEEPTPEQIRVFLSHQVNAFEFEDPIMGKRFFINAVNSTLTDEGISLKGFLEVILDDEYLILLRKTDTRLIKANYNVALNAGEKSDKIIKKETYYLMYPSSLEVYKVTNRRKLNKGLFREHQEEMENFMKSNKIDFKAESDLIKLVSYYNTL